MFVSTEILGPKIEMNSYSIEGPKYQFVHTSWSFDFNLIQLEWQCQCCSCVVMWKYPKQKNTVEGFLCFDSGSTTCLRWTAQVSALLSVMSYTWDSFQFYDWFTNQFSMSVNTVSEQMFQKYSVSTENADRNWEIAHSGMRTMWVQLY
jgi:hypothetical protein